MSYAEATQRARHDLGKYICFEARWLPDHADAAALRQALAQDLLKTRAGPSGTTDAITLWAQLKPTLPPAEIGEIDGWMQQLDQAARHLDTLDTPALWQTAALARKVAEALRALALRFRESP